MAVKTKSKAKPQAKSNSVSAKSVEAKKPKSIVLGRAKSPEPVKEKTVSRTKSAASGKVKVVHKIAVSSNSAPIERRHSKGLRIPQYNFMKAPGITHDFQVGDVVEVYCDHERNRERVRGWIGGIVVQVDNKMVAVQFRSNVYLTDGWMVPDRILWYPLNSEHIRPATGKKSPVKKIEKVTPDY
jgi:hypothetical protein